jgi:hypothetical protein
MDRKFSSTLFQSSDKVIKQRDRTLSTSFLSKADTLSVQRPIISMQKVALNRNKIFNL